MLRVSLLGGVALEIDGREIPPPASPEALALVGWLALHPGPHERSDVAAALWPELPEDAAGAALSATLSDIESELGDDGAGQLLATGAQVELSPDTWVDAREFAQLYAAGELEAAAALSRAELLEGLDDDWMADERDAHRERLLDVLERLAAQADAAGDLAAAVRWTREQVALDPLSEPRHRALIERLAATGDRVGAMAAFELLRARLRSDLRIKPSHETRALIERLGN